MEWQNTGGKNCNDIFMQLMDKGGEKRASLIINRKSLQIKFTVDGTDTKQIFDSVEKLETAQQLHGLDPLTKQTNDFIFKVLNGLPETKD